IAVIVFFTVGIIVLPDESQSETVTCGQLDISWQRVMEDGSTVPVSVPGTVEAERGETVTITGVLPRDFSMGDITPWLCFRSNKQDMEIYIDGRLRETYSTEDSRLWGKNSVSAYILLPLTAEDFGRNITVSMTTHSDYTGMIREVYYGTDFGIWRHLAKENIFEVISALFILVLAVCSIIIDGIMSIKTSSRFNLGYLGWGILFLAVWMLSQLPIRQLYYRNISLAGHMTYFSLYLFSIPCIMFINNTQKKRYAYFYRPIMVAATVFFILTSVLQAAGIADFNDLLPVMHFIFAVEILCIVISLLLDIKRGFVKEYNLIIYGFIAFAACSVLQMILYVRKDVDFTVTITCVGAVFMLVMAAVDTIRKYVARQQEIDESRLKTQKLTYQAMETLVHTIEAKDKYTMGHSTRVAEYSRLLAQKAGLSEEEQGSIYYMATLHDIGKIGIADSIINKPGKLTDEEYSIIKNHTEAGFDILQNMNEVKDIEYGARWHHERYDGKGYPDGLAGEDIPLYARIIAVADTYDAMTSNRSYRQIMPQEKVRAEIQRVSGTQLDPVIAGYMIEIIDADKDYKLRQQPVK
ncbi:MAG: HD-GYP domain-containing protein, partial [Oscillospiraceae bacterium]